MSRKTAMAALEALLDRAEQATAVVQVTYGLGYDVIVLQVADVRAILAKARFADRVNESRSTR